MLSFVKNWLGPKANPIGVDFGSDSLKLAQVVRQNNEWRLVAAASADVPSHVRHDPAARTSFFIETTRELLAQGGFSGRSAVLALPAAFTFIQHLRLPKMDEEAMKKAIPWEARGKLPIDPTHALIRHHVAGEVYQDQEAKNEVILMAAGRDLVDQFLSMASKAKLDVVGMHVEPVAVLDCFSHIYRRRTDNEVTTCFIDLGHSGTRAVIARGTHILFARSIPIGGEHFTRAVATGLSIAEHEARLLRTELCNAQPSPGEPQQKPEAAASEPPPESFALLGAALAAARKAGQDEGNPGPAAEAADRPKTTEKPEHPVDRSQLVEEACREPLSRLVEELELCRRYYEAAFTGKPLDRLVFVGGESRHRWLCTHIAREMGLAAQVGDPLVRMGRTSEIGIESGIDRRQPQPNWAVAIGLSLGPVIEAARAAA